MLDEGITDSLPQVIHTGFGVATTHYRIGEAFDGLPAALMGNHKPDLAPGTHGFGVALGVPTGCHRITRPLVQYGAAKNIRPGSQVKIASLHSEVSSVRLPYPQAIRQTKHSLVQTVLTLATLRGSPLRRPAGRWRAVLASEPTGRAQLKWKSILY